MNLHRIIAKVYCEPWAITPQGFDVIHGTIQRHLNTDLSALRAEEGTDFNGDEMPKMEVRGDTAIIPVRGPLFIHASMMDKLCGACSYDDIHRDLDEAENVVGVQTIWLNINSPGGQCVGNQECADHINELVEKGYNVYAFTDSEMCSAAYNLAAGCSAICSTRSAWVGSIGTMMALLDRSEAYKMQGLKTELFKSGPLKGVGTSGLSISDDQRAYLQGLVDSFSKMFKDNVRASRGIPEDKMQGQCVIGEDAAGVGLVDEICGSLDEAIEAFS